MNGLKNSISLRYFFSIIFIMCSGALLIFFMARNLSRRSAAIAQMRAELYTHENSIEFLKFLKNAYSEVEPYRARLEALLPFEDNLGDALGKLDRLADRLGLSVSTKINERSSEEGGGPFIPLVIKITRVDSQTLQSYLDELEKMPFFISVTSVHFEGPFETKGSAELKARLFIRLPQSL